MSDQEQDFSLKRYFYPLTTLKVVHFIIITGLLVFFNSLFNPFILDDISQIVYNTDVHNLGNIFSFFYHSLTYPGIHSLVLFHMYYKPLLFVVYTLLYSPFGGSSFPFHFLQLVIHISNTILLFFLFSHFIKRPVAFILSLFYLVHPINSETVIYIANMQDVLFVFFGLLALNIVIFSGKSNYSYMRLSFVSLLLILSLLSKETGILFPMMLLLYVGLFARANMKRISIFIGIAIIIYTSLRFIASFYRTSIITPSLIQQASFWTRVINIPKIVFYYSSHFLLPIHLATGQEWVVRSVDFSNFFLPLILDIFLFACIIFGGVFLFKNKKHLFKTYLFFALWFCLGLGMHIQLIPLDVTVADRWFYFPIIGLFGMIGVMYSSFSPDSKVFRGNLALVVILVVIVCLSFLTIVRNSQWQTPMQLYSHDVQYSGDSPVIYSYYGALLMNDGQYDMAKYYLQKSVSLDPRIGSNLDNLALLYIHDKDFSHANALYWENIKLNSNLSSYVAISYEGLALISLTGEKNPQEAKKIADIALQKYPSDALLFEYLAGAEYQLGEKKEALQAIQKAIVLAPDAENQHLYLLMKANKLIF